MSWFLIASIGYFLLGVVFVLDKLILTKSVDKPVVYTFYSTIFLFAALFAWPFGVELLQTAQHWWVALVSGISFGLAMWAMFVAVKKGEASHINPFIGGVVTMATYAFSSLLLEEHLNAVQIVGVFVLLFASFLLSFEKTKRGSRFFHKGFIWAIVAGVLFAFSHTSAKYLYDIYPFLTAFIWTRATTGLVGFFCLAYPSVRASFRSKKQLDKTDTRGFARRHAGLIIILDKIISILGVVCVQYAIALGSVTLVNALSGLQYAFMFVLIYLLTKLSPRVFKEYFTKQELLLQTIAILLVLIGSAMFVL